MMMNPTSKLLRNSDFEAKNSGLKIDLYNYINSIYRKVEHRNVEKEDSIHEEISEESKEDAHWDLRDDVGTKRDHRLSHLIKGWFPYRKFSSSSSNSRMRLAERGCSSRSSRNVLGSFKNCLRRSGRKNDSRRLSWKIK